MQLEQEIATDIEHWQITNIAQRSMLSQIGQTRLFIMNTVQAVALFSKIAKICSS